MTVIWIVAGVLAVLGLLALLGYILSKFIVGTAASRGQHSLGPLSDGDHQESAAILAPAAIKGFGMLRITDRQLLFAGAGTAEPLVVERSDIETVQTTTTPADATKPLKRPALAIVRRSDPATPLILAVTDPQEWVNRLG